MTLRWPKILILVAAWWITLIVTGQVTSHLIEYRPNNDFTRLGFWTNTACDTQSCQFTGPMGWAGLQSLYNFDGVHYYTIAKEGYNDQGRFMPFLPGLIAVGMQLGLGNYSGIVMAGLGLLLMSGALHLLLSLDYSRQQQFWILLAVLASPTAFFLGMVYTESWFIGLVAIILWSARQKKWLLTAIVTNILLVTRLTGIIILPVLLVEWLTNKTPKTPWKQYLYSNWQQLLPIAVSPLLLLIFSYFNYLRWDDWLYFIHAHSDLGNSRTSTGLVFPLQTVWRYTKILTTVSPTLLEWWVSAGELLTFASVTAWLGWLSFKHSLPASYLVLGWLALLLPASSGTFSGLPRYAIVILPIWISLGILPNQRVKKVLILSSFLIMLVLYTLVSRGYFIA